MVGLGYAFERSAEQSYRFGRRSSGSIRSVTNLASNLGTEWRPSPLPEPPPDLSERPLPIIELHASDTALFQCHGRKRGPLNFNYRNRGRFNAPGGEFGVTYLSTSPEGAFAERFLQDGNLRYSNSGWPALDRETFGLNCLCEIGFTEASYDHPLRLVNLIGPVAGLGADGRLSSSTEYGGLTQRWSRALWLHPSAPDGIIYIARHDQSRRSIVLYDRAKHLLRASCATNLLDNKLLINRYMTECAIGYIDHGGQ